MLLALPFRPYRLPLSAALAGSSLADGTRATRKPMWLCRIADVWNGFFVVIGKEGFLQSYGRSESAGTVFRLLAQDGSKVLVEPESGRFVTITTAGRNQYNGFLALGSRQRQSAARFSISASNFQPEIQLHVFGPGPGQRTAANVELLVTRSDGSSLTKHLRTNTRGTFVRPFNAPRGSSVRLTPRHDDYVFSPSHRVVDATHNSSSHFSAIKKVEPGPAINFQSQFLAGFTAQHGWKWEREWSYPSGFFRVGLGAEAGIGLRIPLEVTGSMTPGSFKSAARTEPQRVTINLQGRAFDAPESFYEVVRVPRHLRAGGREVVLKAQASYKLKFRALWKTWVDVDKSHGIDLSRNWTPPWRPGTADYRIVIPPELTHSVVDFSVLKGEAIAAVALGGQASTIHLKSVNRVDGQAVSVARPLTLRYNAPFQTQFELQPAETSQFGFGLTAPDEDLYRFHLYAVPEVKVRIRANVDLWYDDFSRTFETDWIRLNQLKLNLGSASFPRHDPSIKNFVFEDGFVHHRTVE